MQIQAVRRGRVKDINIRTNTSLTYCVPELSKSLQSATGKLYAVKCDVSKDSDIDSSFKWIKDNLGGVDILVTNAVAATIIPLIGKWPRQLAVVLMVWFLLAPSLNCEKRRLASPYPSVYPHSTTRLPLDRFSLNSDNHNGYLIFVGPCIIVTNEEEKPTRCYILYYCTSYRLNMFRALLCPTSGARDHNDDYISPLILILLCS